jgi:hypothetical protein
MTLTKIEAHLFGGNRAHFVKAFGFADGQISVTIVPVEPVGDADLTATFADARMESVWHDPSDRCEWPLDIIGFDSYQSGMQWRFVLNCGSIEWSWQSAWPELFTAPTI